MFNRNNFLIECAGLVTGQTNGAGQGVGFIRSYTVPLQSLRTAAGLTLTAATNPLIAALETNFIGLQWASSDSTKAQLNFTVPLDYDENSDTITLAILVNSAGTTDSPTLSANVYKKSAGAALSADLAPAASAAIPKTTAATAAAVRTITISGKGIKAKDVLTILIAPGAHTTDAVNVYGIDIQYKSTLVAFSSANR